MNKSSKRREQELLQVTVKPEIKKQLTSIAEARGISINAAVNEALDAWINENIKKAIQIVDEVKKELDENI